MWNVHHTDDKAVWLFLWRVYSCFVQRPSSLHCQEPAPNDYSDWCSHSKLHIPFTERLQWETGNLRKWEKERLPFFKVFF